MKKSYLLVVSIFIVIQLNAQVGVNTPNPNATLEVASSPSDPNQVDGFIPPKLTGEELKAKDGLYQGAQIGSIVYVTAPVLTTTPKTINVTDIGYYYFDGTLWEEMKGGGAGGSVDAINGLTLVGDDIKLGGTLTEPTTITTTATNTLRLAGVQQGNATTGKYMVLDAQGDIEVVDNLQSSLSIPTPAVFVLPTTVASFLNGQGAGGSQIVPMVIQKNSINGLTYNVPTQTVSFQPGTYQISFVYEAVHSSCSISSYFVDFPIDGAGSRRIHSTASHTGANHGGTVSYTTTLTAPKDWQIRLGRGQSGNCTGVGMSLYQNSTEVVIFRLGD